MIVGFCFTQSGRTRGPLQVVSNWRHVGERQGEREEGKREREEGKIQVKDRKEEERERETDRQTEIKKERSSKLVTCLSNLKINALCSPASQD